MAPFELCGVVRRAAASEVPANCTAARLEKWEAPGIARGRARRRRISLFAAIALVAAVGACRRRPVGAGFAPDFYDTPNEALLAVIAGHPAILAVGEAHAPKGAAARSAAAQFMDACLPVLAGRASDVLVELMLEPTGCEDATAEVRRRHEPVVAQQAQTNQADYWALGNRAREFGMVPDVLRPTCADMRAIGSAGDDALAATLEAIARLTVAQVTRLVERAKHSEDDRDKMVVIYGGAVHNDLAPTSPETARWSYAARLDQVAEGRFVALDVIVPEFIGDDAAWRALPWLSQYDRSRPSAKTALIRTGPKSFVLIFPNSPHLLPSSPH